MTRRGGKKKDEEAQGEADLEQDLEEVQSENEMNDRISTVTRTQLIKPPVLKSLDSAGALAFQADYKEYVNQVSAQGSSAVPLPMALAVDRKHRKIIAMYLGKSEVADKEVSDYLNELVGKDQKKRGRPLQMLLKGLKMKFSIKLTPEKMVASYAGDYVDCIEKYGIEKRIGENSSLT